MNVGASMGSEKKTTNSQAQTDPWDETLPFLKKLLGKTGAAMDAAPAGPTADQTAAADKIKSVANAGNPNVGAIQQLATDLFETESRAPGVEAGYGDLNTRLKDTADGKNLDVTNDPNLQKLLQQVGTSASEAVRSRFAAAGRDFSGYEGQNIAKGVADAQTPILVDEYRRQQGRTDAAARDLYGANRETQTTAAELDRLRDTLRTAGIDVGQAALDAQIWGPEKILEVEEMLKQMPVDDIKRFAEILFPAAGLGGQEVGSSQSKGTSTKVGVSAKLI